MRTDEPAIVSGRALRRATAFVVLGLGLRVFRYLMDYPFWCDESRLAANLIDMSYGDLGKPLRYAQASPVGFLAAEITAIRFLGFSTWSLRLVALASALASVVLFRHVAARLLSGLPQFIRPATAHLFPRRNSSDDRTTGVPISEGRSWRGFGEGRRNGCG